VTSITGYVVIELVRGVHGYLKRRRESADVEAAKAREALRMAQAEAAKPAGINPDGAFVLPTPGRPAQHQPQMGHHGGIANPHLRIVPPPAAPYDDMDARVARLEAALQGYNQGVA